MKRREFLKCSATGLGAGAAAWSGPAVAGAPPSPAQDAPPVAAQQVVVRPRYGFEIDIVEGQCGAHKTGQRIRYPQEKGQICPWLMDAMSGAIRVLEYGGTLPWLYEGTPYRKVIDPEGVTTEFIRCPDPTASGVVVKITRTKV